MYHPCFKSEKVFSHREAWIWMIEQATWSPEGRNVNILEKPYRLSRGQLSHSVRFMMEAWGWKKGAVETFLRKLKTWDMVRTDNRTGQLIITICNYDIYQAPTDRKPDSQSDKIRTGRGQASDKKEESKKCKEREERKNTYFEDFENFWSGWNPFDMDKGSKTQARKFYEKARKDTTHEIIIGKRDQYLADCHRNGRKTTHASTWINPSGRRGYEDEYPDENSSDYSTGTRISANSRRSSDDKLRDRVNATAREIEDLLGIQRRANP